MPKQPNSPPKQSCAHSERSEEAHKTVLGVGINAKLPTPHAIGINAKSRTPLGTNTKQPSPYDDRNALQATWYKAFSNLDTPVTFNDFEGAGARIGEELRRAESTQATDPRSTVSGGDLPCLYSHISIESPTGKVLKPASDVTLSEKSLSLIQEAFQHENLEEFEEPKLSSEEAKFTTGRKRSAHILATSVHELSHKVGIENLGFLTLTFADHITCPKEAQKRLNSLLTNVIKKRYGDYVGVMERQKSGRIHYHLLVVVGKDIRTGFDFDQVVNHRNYSSANSNIRSEWFFWRTTAKKYGFGRTELMPVKSSSIAIARYIGKYISKSLQGTNESNSQNIDRGVRLVRYSNGARAGTTRFSWYSNGSQCWRRSVCVFAEMVAEHYGLIDPDISDLKHLLGPRWAYNYRGYILAISDFFTSFERNGYSEEMKEHFYPQLVEYIKTEFNVSNYLKARS